MALTKESRGIFIASVVEFVRQHQLDGLDVTGNILGCRARNLIFAWKTNRITRCC